MQHPDEGTIHAWLDGALNPEESASFEAHAASCAECSAAIAEARGLIAASSRIVSALDIVPGGVIPARKPAVRPWYASTQLRAAAAVIFVAGASFLLVRDRGSESLSDVAQRVMTEQAPAPVQADEDMAATGAATPPQQEPRQTATANSTLRREAVAQRKAEVLRTSPGATGSAVEAAQSATDVAPPAAPAPAPMVAAAPPIAELRDTSRLGKAAVAAAPVVVTGVAATSQKLSSDLRVLGVDSTSGVRVTRYRIASGAELTLTEGGNEFTGRGLASGERRFDAARPMLSVTWTDPSNQRVYTLAGRVSKETLDEVKAKIQGEKR